MAAFSYQMNSLLESMRQNQVDFEKRWNTWWKDQEATGVHQEKLKLIGKKLEHLPQSKEVLLSTLEEAKNCLAKVGQLPSQLMR